MIRVCERRFDAMVMRCVEKRIDDDVLGRFFFNNSGECSFFFLIYYMDISYISMDMNCDSCLRRFDVMVYEMCRKAYRRRRSRTFFFNDSERMFLFITTYVQHINKYTHARISLFEFFEYKPQSNHTSLTQRDLWPREE